MLPNELQWNPAYLLKTKRHGQNTNTDDAVDKIEDNRSCTHCRKCGSTVNWTKISNYNFQVSRLHLDYPRMQITNIPFWSTQRKNCNRQREVHYKFPSVPYLSKASWFLTMVSLPRGCGLARNIFLNPGHPINSRTPFLLVM